MLQGLRSTLHGALAGSTLDIVPPVRATKRALLWLNAVTGRPLAPLPELAARESAEARLAMLRHGSATRHAAPTRRDPAPVMIYWERNRNPRGLERMREVLDGRSIPFQVLDVTGDEAAMAFVMRAARCEQDDLPIAFVAGAAVGDDRALIELDVSGALEAAVFGTTKPS